MDNCSTDVAADSSSLSMECSKKSFSQLPPPPGTIDEELIDPEYPGKYRCIICCSICQNLKAWSYHAAGRRHIMRKNELLKEQQVPENTKDDTIMQNPWQMDELSIFPSRESTLDQHIQVATLNPELKNRLCAYLRARCQHSLEFAEIFLAVAAAHPTHLRLKELIETVESARVIGTEIYLQSKTAPIDTIFDAACGHGLLGILLAYRFAKQKVICIDRTRRPCFDSYVAAFRQHGVSAPGEQHVLDNLEFIEGDIASLQLPSNSFVACVHGCNDANKQLLEKAVACKAGYGVVPCCIPEGLYNLRLRHNDRQSSAMDDATRYAVLVGVVAATYGASRVVAIHRHITNRNLVVLGRAQ